MSKGQATAIQVLMFMALLVVVSSIIISIFNPFTQMNPEPLIALRIARTIDGSEGVVGLKFEGVITVKLYANGTVVVETHRGIGKARVLTKTLIPSSAQGFTVYVVTNSTHAYVTLKP
ncbi:MAG: hypothetical protein DRJ62_04895 [Thermoprotei archaeon]|nr:MAG: hypothetical protein DRJ62_04895 [Thermoprotei archaeon]